MCSSTILTSYRESVPQLILDVFGVPDKSQLKVGKQRLPELDNDFNERVRAVVAKSKDHRAKGVGSITVPHLYVVKECVTSVSCTTYEQTNNFYRDGEPGLKLWAQTMLVEDRADQMPSYIQFMNECRSKLAS